MLTGAQREKRLEGTDRGGSRAGENASGTYWSTRPKEIGNEKKKGRTKLM